MTPCSSPSVQSSLSPRAPDSNARNLALTPTFSGPPVLHTPVLLTEALQALAVRPNGRYIDATVGLAGHSFAILNASSPSGRLLGFDVDPEALVQAQTRLRPFGSRAQLVHANFRELAALASAAEFTAVDGILLDLGVSSLQLGPDGRGFSFQFEARLDMRMDPRLPLSAAELVNSLEERELANLLLRYGEEPQARRVARAIVRARPIGSTIQLAETVAAAAGRFGQRMHPATRTFQALRIAVNSELESLEMALAASLSVLRTGGRLAVISFHSLEDRIVKDFIRSESRDCVCPPSLPICVCTHRARLKALTRTPIVPGSAEVASNPRSRSSKLRIAERL